MDTNLLLLQELWSLNKKEELCAAIELMTIRGEIDSTILEQLEKIVDQETDIRIVWSIWRALDIYTRPTPVANINSLAIEILTESALWQFAKRLFCPESSEKGTQKLEIGSDSDFVTMGQFSKHLKLAGVLDVKGVNLPGSYVMLPYGMLLVERFKTLVHECYREYGLQQYEFPKIAPLENFKLAEDVIALNEKVLYVGTKQHIVKDEVTAGLCPTGEETIYAYWKKQVRVVEDLPLETYQRSRFFRPFASGRHSGQGLFRPAENPDVFEFHCGYPGVNSAFLAFERYFLMLKELGKRFHIPVYHSIRPPWTNQSDVSRLTIGGDTPLPSGGTVQTTCLYFQGQAFSRAFGVEFKGGGNKQPTENITGAVSRRLLLAHLFLGLQDDGSLFLHPDLAPIQVGVLLQTTAGDSLIDLDQLTQRFGMGGVRIEVRRTDQKNFVRQQLKDWKMRGVPLCFLIQGSRNKGDLRRFVICRKDKVDEEFVNFASVSEICIADVETMLEEIGDAYVQSSLKWHSKPVATSFRSEAVECVGSRRIALVPLAFSAVAVSECQRIIGGEVLGFIPHPSAAKCIISSAPTFFYAYVSARI